MFWSKPDNRVMYKIDLEMENLIEGKLTKNSENMSKLLLNMGMA